MANEDMELVRQYVAAQSESAFATLVSRHTDLVYSAALRRTGNAQSAEEITQAVFIILARKAGSLNERTILPGWLYRTACYVSGHAYKQELRRHQREQEAYMQSLSDQTESEAWAQIMPLLEEAMLRLGQTDRDTLVLRFFEGRNLKEVGALLGTSEAAAKMRVNRALEKLRQFFVKRGIVSTTAILAGAISANSVQAAPAALSKVATAAAMAKGATAAASTLTLIKGALKIMAWTKAKTTIIAGTIVLLTAATGIVTIKTINAIRAAYYPDIQGAWEGIALLDDAGVATGDAARSHVVLKLAKVNGIYTATADWIEKGLRDVPMGRVIYDYPSLQLERSPREIWNLRVNSITTQMVWDHSIHFIQPDPVLLTRTRSPDLVPERLAESDFPSSPGSDLQGYWKGTIGPGSDALPVNLKIARQTDGTFRAEADNPMQGVKGQPLLVDYDRPDIKMTLATGAGMFQGKINNANTELTGSWIQNGKPTPAIVKRADYQAELAADADKDYSFHSENDLPGHWKGAWIVTIASTQATIRLALDIAKLPDGSYSALLSNLDELGHDAPIPASSFEYSPPDLKLKWKWNDNTAFDGKLEKGKLIGTWTEGGGGFPLVFERSQSK